MNRLTGLYLILAITFTSSAAQTVNLTGTVSNKSGQPISGAVVSLPSQALLDTTDANGAYSITGSSAVKLRPILQSTDKISLRNGILSLRLTKPALVRVEMFDVRGHSLAKVLNRHASAGDYQFNIVTKPLAAQIMVISVAIGQRVSTFRHLPLPGSKHTVLSNTSSSNGGGRLLAGAPTGIDALEAYKSGYGLATSPISSYEGEVNITLDTITLPFFSFFVTSLKAILELSDSDSGFGGDFRFGFTGPGAGLRGADSICSCIAEKSMPGSSVKQWRAFLSVSADQYGRQVNAIDRIGSGPWHDRLGRVLAPTRADLQKDRPINGDPAIAKDLPNEDGVPNHRPDPTLPQVDNHHFVTGSKTDGTLDTRTAISTCEDWTSKSALDSLMVDSLKGPRCGFSWPRGSGGGTMGGTNWISGFDAGGCVAGIELSTNSLSGKFIGNAGGYGGFYCFALTP
jgi:hypothetical protein